MPDIAALKNRLRTFTQTCKLTDAMRVASISSYSSLSSKLLQVKQVKAQIDSACTSLITGNPNLLHQPFIQDDREVNKVFIIMSSMRGLCGGFNHDIKKLVQEHINPGASGRFKVICLGAKAAEFMRTLNLSESMCKVILHEKNVNLKNSFETTRTITELLLTQPQGFRQAVFLGSTFKNLFTQTAVARTLLPLNSALPQLNKINSEFVEISLEQPCQELLPALLEQQVFTSVYAAIVESFLAETSARFKAMDGASTSAKKGLDLLKIEFCKARQELITKEISEVAASTE